jgi:hypothetical protein
MMIATIFMLAQAAALAQASPAQGIMPDDQQIQQAGLIGIILHALDQAASISTDALLKKWIGPSWLDWAAMWLSASRPRVSA